MFFITKEDKEWVDDSLKWLQDIYGHPRKNNEQFLFTQQYFPETFKSKKLEVEYLLTDLCKILNLDRSRITFEFINDLRDVYELSIRIEGTPFECEVEVSESENHILSYHLIIASSLVNYPGRCCLNLIYELIKIKMTETKAIYNTGEDVRHFIYIAAIYFGFGVILSGFLIDSGVKTDGIWETRWNYVLDIPIPVITYTLAAYAILVDNIDPKWKNELPPSLKTGFHQAVEFLNANRGELYSERRIKNELSAIELYDVAEKHYLENQFEAAISSIQKVLFLTDKEWLKAEVYNALGYYHLRNREFQKSIPNLLKAIEIDPEYGYAIDNLGFAYIITGDLEKGKYYLEKAIQTTNNHDAYSFRNLALYHQKRKEYDLAEENFTKAFGLKRDVDLLDFFYALFKMETGQNDKGMEYLEKAIRNKEPEAIKFYEELNRK